MEYLNENNISDFFLKEIEIKEFYKHLIISKKDIIIFSTSYPSTRFIIPLLQKLSKEKINIELIVFNDDLYKLYTKYYFNLYTKIVCIANTNNKKSTNLFQKIWNNIFLEKLLLHKLKNKIHYTSNVNVIFFAIDFIYRDFYLLKYLKRIKNNQLFLIKIGYLIKAKKNTSIKNIIFQFLYGKEINLVKAGKVVFTRIKKEFLSEITLINIALKNINDLLEINIRKISLNKNIKIVYFDTTLENTPYLDYKDVINKKEKILKILLNNVKNKDEIGIKLHPISSQEQEREFLKYGNIIPSYIPSEFLSFQNCKLVVSYISHSLDKNYLKHTQGVSIIHIFNWSNKEVENNYKKYMFDINPDLFFPKTINEFDKIIKNIINKK